MQPFTYTQSTRTRSASENLKLSHIPILILTACVFFLTLPPMVTAQTVHTPDPNLRAALESALGKEAGADITRTEMASLETLEAFESGIFNLTGLEFAINLTGLHLGLNHVSDVSPLKDLTKLTVLDLHRNEEILDISPLKDLTNLTWLSLRGNRILDMYPLKDLTNLTYLHIGYNKISDVSTIKDLTNLVFLNLDENRIIDVSPLKTLTNLRYLALDDNMISDVSPLSVLTNLRFLNLNDNQIISDVSSLSVLTNLKFIDLHGNQISDVSPLKDMVNMTNLRLQENQISDLSPLKDMTKLTRLILHDNHIFDFSPIAGLIENLIEYDNSNQTPLPSKMEDVNRDNVVDIIDLILVAVHYRNPDFADFARFNVYPDVNNDGIVDVEDLLAIAAEIDTDAAAPVLRKNLSEISGLSVENLSQWIHLARQLHAQEPRIQRGIVVLERILAILTLTEASPKATALLANYPNPFNPETWIPYQLAKPAKVCVSIHSTDGKLVRTLELRQLSAGIYHSKSRAAYWDGQNDLGESVASGVYFYTFTADDFSATRKMFIRK